MSVSVIAVIINNSMDRSPSLLHPSFVVVKPGGGLIGLVAVVTVVTLLCSLGVMVLRGRVKDECQCHSCYHQ